MNLVFVCLIVLISIVYCKKDEDRHSLTNTLLRSRPYEFIPIQRRITTPEGEAYIISFENLKRHIRFVKCFYISELRNGSYNIPDIVRKKRDIIFNPPVSSTKNKTVIVFETFEKQKKCGFASSLLPYNWTIKAYDNISHSYFTEHVMVYEQVPILFKTLSILAGNHYLNVLKTPNVKLSSCTLMFDNNTLDINVDYHHVLSHQHLFFPLSNRALGLGKNSCGYTLNPAKLGDPSEFTIKAVDNQGNKYKNSFTINTYDKELLYANHTVTVQLGNSTNVICGRVLDNFDGMEDEYCLLYNQKNKQIGLKQKICNHTIDITTLQDLGNWTCVIGHSYSSAPILMNFTTLLQEKVPPSVESFALGQHLFQLGCIHKNYAPSQAMNCTFKRPDGVTMTVAHSKITGERYSYVGTDLLKQKCSIEFMRPFQDGEIGSWKCEIAIRYEQSVGTYITVGKESQVPMNLEMKRILTYLNDPFEVKCIIPVHAKSCHVIAPNSSQFPPERYITARMGVCNYLVKSATAKDNGTWTCHFERGPESLNEFVTQAVSVLDVVDTNGPVLETNEGKWVVLWCRSQRVPLNYCYFMSPHGVSYSMTLDHEFNNHTVSYPGLGLKEGDCAINLTDPIPQLDTGEWRCSLGFGGSNHYRVRNLRSQIQLNVVPTIMGIPKWLFFTVGTVMAVLLFGLLYMVVFLCTKEYLIRLSNRKFKSTAEVFYAVRYTADGVTLETSSTLVPTSTTTDPTSAAELPAELPAVQFIQVADENAILPASPDKPESSFIAIPDDPYSAFASTRNRNEEESEELVAVHCQPPSTSSSTKKGKRKKVDIYKIKKCE